MSMNDLFLSVQAAPDPASIRRLAGLPAELLDEEVVEYALQRQRARAGNEVLPLQMQRVISLGWGLRVGELLDFHELQDVDEARLLRRFFAAIPAQTRLVIWSAQEASSALLSLRALLAGVAGAHWQQSVARGLDLQAALGLPEPLPLAQALCLTQGLAELDVGEAGSQWRAAITALMWHRFQRLGGVAPDEQVQTAHALRAAFSRTPALAPLSVGLDD